MSKISFTGVILAANVPGREDEASARAFGRAQELFDDSGVDELIVLRESDIGEVPVRARILEFPPGRGAFAGIWLAAAATRSTHLLVLDLTYREFEPVIFLRFMQMSCLGMGVLPYLRGVSQPLVACYPRSILKLAETGGFERADPQVIAAEAQARGLVAPYHLPTADESYFVRADSALTQPKPSYFSSR